MKQELAKLLAAFGFFTRLPVPVSVTAGDSLGQTLRYFPMVGLIVGLIGATVTELTALALPASIAIVLGMIATILATGALHEDGLADVCDGFGGGWDKAQVLAIMKDSRVGSYALVGVGLILLLKWNALAEIDVSLGAWTLACTLLAAHSVSRLAAVVLTSTLNYARDDTSTKSQAVVQRLSALDWVIAGVTGLVPCLLLPLNDALVALVAVAVTTLLAGRYFYRRIGGYTGDCLGATQQLGEIAFYLGVLCSFT